MPHIKLAFFSGDAAMKPWLAVRILRFLFIGKYSHCEIIFEGDNKTAEASANNANTTSEFVTCSVAMLTDVYFKRKSFNRAEWEFVTIILDDAEKVARIRNFCYNQAQQEKEFNFKGMLRSVTPFPRPTSGDEWFCSELITAALQQGGMLLEKVPSAMTPSSLFRAVLNELPPSSTVFKSATPLFLERIRLHCDVSVVI
jgi:hypothetical protein